MLFANKFKLKDFFNNIIHTNLNSASTSKHYLSQQCSLEGLHFFLQVPYVSIT